MSGTVSKLNEYLRDTLSPSVVNYINEYMNNLTEKQRQMLIQGKASIKEWGDGEYEYISEVEDDEDGQKKYRNNGEQKNAMHKKQVLARRKKNKNKKRK